MPTRVVHRVRCRKHDNKQIWADVKVVDAVTVIQPGGQERLVWVKTRDANPCIIDKTKAVPSLAKGTPEDCTRLSHMELVTGQDDPQQKMYIEVLDAVVFNPPTNHNTEEAQGGTREQQPDSHGMPKPATFGKGLYGLFLPEKAATKFVVDKVGLGLGDGSSESASRSGHVNLVTEKGNTDDKTDESDKIPPERLNWLAAVKIDAINFKVPQGDVCMVLPKGVQDEVDWTVMTTDPDTGEPCPPDNTDPNVYVSFPRDDTQDPNAPCIGCNLKIPKRPGGQQGIDQGPLWWIERISPGFRPWFWYADINEPKAFSYFGSPGRLGNWAWRGFVLWNNYPVIWILASNLPIQPMGQFGSPSLDLCARIGDWDFGFPPVPSSYFQVPGRGDPDQAQAAPSQMELLAGVVAGGIIAGANDANEAAIGRSHGGPFGPFGILQFTHPPLGPLPDAVPYGAVNPGSEIFDGKPNIFQLTGKLQPKRPDPTRQWEPFSNPYPPPSAKLAEETARLFESNWNAVAHGHNEFIQQYQGGGGVSNGGASYTQPPGWNWAIPWFDGSTGPPTDYRASFQNGIPPGVATKFFPLEIYAPATAWTLKVDQLRPDWWDTTYLEFFGNPLNAFFPIVLPPFLWTNDPWTGTNNPPHNNPSSGAG